MKLSLKDLEDLCIIAINAAQKAGNIIASYANTNIAVQNKAGGDSIASQVVTEVDVKSQAIIVNELRESMAKYDLALLTEESPDDNSRLEKDYFWCVDPMDGTLAFIERTPGFAVSIALVSKNGESQVGVVYDPSTETLYHAINGQGAYKNNKKWMPNLSSEKANVLTLFIDKSFKNHPKFAQVKSKFQQYAIQNGLKNVRIIAHAGAVLNACWVMDNAPSCYFKFPKKQKGGGSLWDFAATTCIVKEAGAFVFDFHGEALHLNKPGSTFMNQKGVLFASDLNIRNFVLEINRLLSK